MSSHKEIIRHLKNKSLAKTKHGSNPLVLMIVILGVILVAATLFYLGRSFLSEKDIAKLIPEDQTIAFLEVKNALLPSAISRDVLDPQKVGPLIQTVMGFDLNELSSRWINKRMAAVILEVDSNPQWVFFLETGSQRATLNKLKEMNLIDESHERNDAVLSHSQKTGRYFGLVSTYLVTSDNENAIRLLAEASEAVKLYENANYQNTLSHLPRLSWAKAYMDPQKWKQEDMSASFWMQPLNFAINHIAFTVKKESNGFYFNSLTSLNKDLLSLQPSLATQGGNFAYKLTRFLPAEQTAFYTGGENLFREWQNTLEGIANLNPSYGLLLESLVRAQFANIFGEGVDLRNDLYPLLEGEYAFSAGLLEGGKRAYQLVISHGDKDFAQIKLEKLMEGFKSSAGRFSPQLRVVELPDGSQSRELVPNESFQEAQVENYQGQEIHCLESPTSDKNFCYTIGDDWLAMTSGKEAIINAIDLSVSDDHSLYNAQAFRRNLSKLSKVNNELSFVNMPNMVRFLESNPYVAVAAPFLGSFNSATWVKHFFDDGVSLEGFILIE